MTLPQTQGWISENGDAPKLAGQALYGPFYGLMVRPFDLAPDPKFLFLTPRQREALSNLVYGLTTPRGFTLLTGDAGTGKTTLVQAVLSQLRDSRTRYVVLSHPTINRAEFYEFVAQGLGLSARAVLSRTQFLSELRAQVEARFAAGGLTGLIVDEAQSLPYELLEEIRLLGNIEVPSTKLLNIVLAGQPELADRLNEESLRQLKQRITLRCQLTTLDLHETGAYIAGRLSVAGALPADVFTREAVMAVHRLSGGVPRTINVVCDNALITGFAEQIKPIPARIVEEVGREFDLGQIARPKGDGQPEVSRILASAPISNTLSSGGAEELGGTLQTGNARKRRFSVFKT